MYKCKECESVLNDSQDFCGGCGVELKPLSDKAIPSKLSNERTKIKRKLQAVTKKLDKASQKVAKQVPNLRQENKILQQQWEDVSRDMENDPDVLDNPHDGSNPSVIAYGESMEKIENQQRKNGATIKKLQDDEEKLFQEQQDLKEQDRKLREKIFKLFDSADLIDKKQLPYEESIEATKHIKAIVEHILKNYPGQETASRSKMYVFDRHGSVSTKASIKRVTALAKKHKDKELQKLIDIHVKQHGKFIK